MSQTTGAENVRWNFDDLYASETDPQIEADLQDVLQQAAEFAANYRGQLGNKLGDALKALCRFEQLQSKLYAYLAMRSAVDTENEAVKKVLSSVQERLAQVYGTHLTFFEHEVAHLPEDLYQNLMIADEWVQRHRPFLDDIRRNARYLLAENVEEALAKRSPFGAGEWHDFMDDKIADLSFSFEGKEQSLEEMHNLITTAKEADRRAAVAKAVNNGVAEQKMTKVAASALNVVMGAKAVEDAERGYTYPMEARNLSNKVSKETVEALHTAVAQSVVPLAKRYYRLKAQMLGIEKLAWGDRNAPLPITDTTVIPWDKGFTWVKEAFESFSPTLRGLVDEIEANGWIDAPASKGKRGGAFCAGFGLPGKDGEAEPRAYVLLNHLGTLRDFSTLAHELGHAVNDMLAIPAQNNLMCDPPMVYAETASIFAEMVTFEHLMTKCENNEARLALYMDKCSDFLNTVLRQICFSNFEQEIHLKRREGKLTTEDFTEIWIKTTKELYGEEGEVFKYENMDNLWCYVHHFLRPFYVYAYAFGELFTQSLYAVKDQFGADFEPMYLDLLRAGNTKDAVALMQPFGLDPADPTFWQRGIEASLGVWLQEAEKLSQELQQKG